jgi:hypothetical protein
MRLERCVRLVPHDHDGGGFFIAVLDKVGQHHPDAGALPAGEPEICVADAAAVLPEALLAINAEEGEGGTDTEPPGRRDELLAIHAEAGQAGGESDARTCDSADPASAGAGEAGDVGAVRGHGKESTQVAAQVPPVELTPSAPADPSPANGGVSAAPPASLGTLLHAHNRAVSPAELAVALTSGFPPLFGISDPLRAELLDYFGLGGNFPFDLMVARSQQVGSCGRRVLDSLPRRISPSKVYSPSPLPLCSHIVLLSS